MPEKNIDTWEDKPAQKHKQTKEEELENRISQLEKFVKELQRKLDIKHLWHNYGADK